MHSLLRTKRFLPLFIVQFLQAMNDNLIRYAFIVLLTFNTTFPSSHITTLNSIAIALFILPYFILSAFAGQLADKFNKAIIIQWVKLTEVFVMVLVAVGFYWLDISMLLFAIFLLGAHSTIFGPIKYAILPQHLKPHELIAGNALVESGTFFAIILGILLGSQLYPLDFGPEIVVILGFVFAIIGLFVSWFIPQAKPYNNFDNRKKISYNLCKLTSDILKEAFQHKQIFYSILGISYFWLISGMYMSLFPEFVRTVLHASHSVFNYFIVVFSVGIAVGTLISNRLQKGEIHSRFVIKALILMTISTLGFYLVSLYAVTGYVAYDQLIGLWHFLREPIAWFLSLMILLIAIFGGIFSVPLYAMVQHLSDQGMCARMIAANNMINAIFLVVMSLVISVWIYVLRFSILDAFLLVSLLNLLLILVIFSKRAFHRFNCH